MNFHSKVRMLLCRDLPVTITALFLCLLLSLDGTPVSCLPGAGPMPVYAQGQKTEEHYMQDLLFLGDSMIFNPEDIAHLFSEHGHQVFAGMGATLPQFYGVTRRKVTVGMRGHQQTGTIAGRDCHGIVILMGANDLAVHDVDTVFSQYQKLLRELQSVSAAPVYVLQVFPVNENYSRHYGDAKEKNRRAAALNEKLWLYCEASEGLYFVDATNGFLGHDGQLLHDYGDGLHMDPAYYGMFYEDIMVAMASLKDQIKGSVHDPDRHLEQYWLYQWARDTAGTQLNSRG